MTVKFLIACAITAALPSLAAAQDTASPSADSASIEERLSGDSVTIGIGGAYMPDYEGSNDYRILPVPAAIGSLGGVNFQVLGNRASADLMTADPGASWDIQAGPMAAVNFMRSNRQSIGDPRVRRLGERDTAIEVGGYLGIGKSGVITSPYDKLSFSVSYRHDVAGVHKSGIWQPTFNYFTPLSRKAAIGLFASAEHVDQQYVRTYYNVSPNGADASGLPVYQRGKGGWKNWTVGVAGGHSLTGDLLRGFKLVGGATYRRMLGDVARSPLVSIAGSRSQWMGVLGLAYTF